MLTKILSAIIFLCIGILSGFMIQRNLAKPIVISDEIIIEKERIILVREKYLTRNEINEIIEQDVEKYLEHYLEIIDDENIVSAVMFTALRKNVPVNLAFALARVESNFNTRAKNGNNSSYDAGLFQLNSKSFPNANYYDIVENTKIALSYLLELSGKTGSWEKAIVFYNCGQNVRSIPIISINHLWKVLKQEEEYNDLFNEEMK